MAYKSYGSKRDSRKLDGVVGILQGSEVQGKQELRSWLLGLGLGFWA